ncbi:MAG: hypothetical protein ACFNS8_00885, partial [Kingella oralis]
MGLSNGFQAALGVGKGSLKMYRKRWLRCARFQAALSGGIFGSLKTNPSGKKPFGIHQTVSYFQAAYSSSGTRLIFTRSTRCPS